MRKNLKEARQKAGMTQKQIADQLGITMRSYQRIESGELLGSIAHWDALEDLFNVHQRILRLETCPEEGWRIGIDQRTADLCDQARCTTG